MSSSQKTHPRGTEDYTAPRKCEKKTTLSAIDSLGVSTLYVEPGSPWQNGYAESFGSKLRDELLNAELFDSLAEAEVVSRDWQNNYNTRRPHSALGYQTPLAFAAGCGNAGP